MVFVAIADVSRKAMGPFRTRAPLARRPTPPRGFGSPNSRPIHYVSKHYVSKGGERDAPKMDIKSSDPQSSGKERFPKPWRANHQ